MFPVPLPALVHIPDHPVHRQGKLPADFIDLIAAVLDNPPFLRLMLADNRGTLKTDRTLTVMLIAGYFHLLIHVIRLQKLFHPISFHPLQHRFQIPVLVHSGNAHKGSAGQIMGYGPFKAPSVR